MTDAGQTGLDDFATSDEERPDEEAAAIAGNGNGGGNVAVIDSTTEALPDPSGTVELAVTQIDYTIEGSGPDERPLIHVFGRTEDRTAEHVVGMRKAETVVAINRDARAPIFRVADYGVVGDFRETVPALVDALAAASEDDENSE